MTNLVARLESRLGVSIIVITIARRRGEKEESVCVGSGGVGRKIGRGSNQASEGRWCKKEQGGMKR